MRSNVYSFVRHIVKCNYHTLSPLSIRDRSNFQQDIPVCYMYHKDMPRNTTQMLILQRARQKIRNKSTKYAGNINVSLHILGTGARGTSRCVYLNAGNTRYIFNCGEGTQRLAYEHKYKLMKLEHIFITSTSWSNVGGMPGMLLTIQDVGVPKINIHGPKGTVEIFDAIKKFVMLYALRTHEAKCDESEPYADSVMTVSYVCITKSNVQQTEIIDMKEEEEGEEVDNDINYYDYKINSDDKKVSNKIVEEKKKAQKLGQKSTKQRISSVMSYICKLKPRAGTLSLEKCVERGVTPGPLLGELKAGKDITLSDGTVVLSKDVCSPEIPGPLFLVVECPSEDYLESFVNHPAFAKHQASNQDDIPYCIIHFTPQNVMDDSRYMDWMSKFGLNTRHIVLNEENECMGTEAIHKHQHKLHLLNSEIFPFLDEESFQKKLRAEDLAIVQRPRTHYTIHLQPELKINVKNEVSLDPTQYINEAFEIEGFLDALAELQTATNARTKTLVAKEYPKVVMLGTGSSIPSKVRNTSGILLRVDENHSMLLDCGEGTFGQIVKIYGKSKTDDIMKTIKGIYVSHLHADHHIGLISLLKERGKITQSPIYLFAPVNIASWLRTYHERFEPILHRMILISNSELYLEKHHLESNKHKEMYHMLNIRAIKTVYVKHCPYSYGVSVTLRDGTTIVYSGDTMPCEKLVTLGQDCDLLIHEATMEDDLMEEAELKLHSTVSQAIEIGEQMRSKFTLLTHFSQRYSIIPHLPENGLKLNNVGIAYDNMHISLSQLPLLPLMYPALKILFKKHYIDLEERAAKRQKLTRQP